MSIKVIKSKKAIKSKLICRPVIYCCSICKSLFARVFSCDGSLSLRFFLRHYQVPRYFEKQYLIESKARLISKFFGLQVGSVGSRLKGLWFDACCIQTFVTRSCHSKICLVSAYSDIDWREGYVT